MLRAAFLNSGVIDILGQMILCCVCVGSFHVRCRMFSGILVLYPLDASCTHPSLPIVTTKNMPLDIAIPWRQNHTWLRTTAKRKQ